jgi:hypothetical protein
MADGRSWWTPRRSGAGSTAFRQRATGGKKEGSGLHSLYIARCMKFKNHKKYKDKNANENK